MADGQNSGRWIVGVLAGVAVAGAGLVALTVWRAGPVPAPVPAPQTAAPQSDRLPAPEPPPRAAADAPQPAPADLAPPAFDVVRVDAQGNALVAGQALAGSAITIQVAGVALTRVQTGPDGRFVAFFSLSPSDTPRALRLVMETGAGQSVSSEATVLLAPVAAPELAQAAHGAATSSPQSPLPAPEARVAAPADPAAPSGASRLPDSLVPAAADPPAASPPAAASDRAPGVFLAEAGGVRMLQPPAGEVAPGPETVMIDTVSYDAAGNVRVSGRGAAGVALRLYIDNRAVGAAQSDAQGQWRLGLGGIAPGLYTLRVDQLTADGQVSARVETPFLREQVERGAAAGQPGAAAVDTGAPPGGPARLITVQPGYTLWGIAEGAYGRGLDFVKIYNANRDQIRDPDLIYPGQIFALPGQVPGQGQGAGAD